MAMLKKELKETLDKLGIAYKKSATNPELQALIEANNNPESIVTEKECAPDPNEVPEYTESPELKSQVSASETSVDSLGDDGYVDPNWGDK